MLYISIRNNKTLADGAFLTGVKKAVFEELVLSQAIKSGALYDAEEFCGRKLADIFADNDYSLTAATLYCLKRSDRKLEVMFAELIIWGLSEECPECGCDTELFDSGEVNGGVWEEWHCTNCDYKDSNEPDPDADRD